jgi:hypothetical protein
MSDQSQVLKQNVIKEEFGWEVPVESVPIPSRGIIYDPDTTLYNRQTVPIKAMTAHEEDILSSQAFIKDGTVIDQLIKSCITDKTFSVDSLTIGDRNAIMVAIRITGYGSDYNVKTTCQNCSNKANQKFNLANLPIKRLEIEPIKSGENAFEFTLPVTKKKIIFKFLTSGDERQRSRANKNEIKVLGTKIEKNVTSYLKYSIISIDGVTDMNKIHHFVTNMPAFDSRSLRTYIAKHEPGMEMAVKYECKSCDHLNEITLPITSEFFWPGT